MVHGGTNQEGRDQSVRHDPDPIDIAVRVYPEVPGFARTSTTRKRWRRPTAMFIFDTETRTDATQSLLFGCFRFVVDGHCLREGLFYGRDLSERERNRLERYASSHEVSTVRNGRKTLDLLTQDEFLNELFRAGYKGRSLIVGFNLPFDLSRIAFDVAPARGKYSGGFSLGIWSYADKRGHRKRNPFRPRVCVKHVDSKRALIGFSARRSPDKLDLDPDENTGKLKTFRGHFLDLRTLAFALTDRGHSLKSACNAFGVEHGKSEPAQHGKITSRYIDYCRRDVEATHELAQLLIREFDLHPILLQETRAFSPASIGKAYLRAMGISPIMQRQKGVQPFVGYAQTAFFGGRTSAHIRKFPVPVVYTDFLSMYPTVNSLMDLWQFVIAKEIKIRTGCADEIRTFLENLTVGLLFLPEFWKKLPAFVCIKPNGNVLPTRGQFDPETNDWQVSVNHLYARSPDDVLWFSLPDVVASVILTGRVPEIFDAFVLEPVGILSTLRATKLRGRIEIDPRRQDFFKVVIEQRKQIGKRKDLQHSERERLGKALKVLANATSYGIYAEMNRVETNERVQVLCHGMDDRSFSCRVSSPEIPGEFCFPPMASLITGGARLMLALLERCVSDRGGTYAMEDTDSMAIVATEHGGLIDCPGGCRRKRNGTKAIKALSWQQVREIAHCFHSLNPYESDAIPGSILKIEEDNFDPRTNGQRQLWCYAISAKRYVLFVKDGKGLPELLRQGTNSNDNHWSEHGLGHLLNPTDPSSEDRGWIAQVWKGILLSQAGKRVRTASFHESPAVGRFSVSGPSTLRVLDEMNSAKEYAQQIKPFNFLLSCQVRPFGHPINVDPARFHLIAPYETAPRKWTQMRWLDQYSGKVFRVSTDDHYSSRWTASVKTFGDVISEYAFHAEAKCADSRGKASGKNTVGLLQRRHVHIDRIRFIGKESNLLEEVDAGLIHSNEEAYTEYIDLRRDEWELKIRPALKSVSIPTLCLKTGLSRRMIINARTGKARPHPRNQALLSSVLRALGKLA